MFFLNLFGVYHTHLPQNDLSKMFGPTCNYRSISFIFFSQMTRVYHAIMVIITWLNVGILLQILWIAFATHNLVVSDGIVALVSGSAQATFNTTIMFWNCERQAKFHKFITSFISYIDDYCNDETENKAKMSWARIHVSGALCILAMIVLGFGPLIASYYSGFYSIEVNQWYMILQVLSTLGSLACVCPTLFYAFICCILKFLFSDVTKKFSEFDSGNVPITGSNLDSFRRQHARICNLLQNADDIFSPIVAVTLVTNTISAMFTGYILIDSLSYNLPLKVIWFSIPIIFLFVISCSAAVVHEEVMRIETAIIIK